MRKQTIWLLIGVLACTFIGILVMQFSYLDEMVDMRKEQFNEAVSQSLFVTAGDLERDETLRYLDEHYDETQRNLLKSLNASEDQTDRKSSSKSQILNASASYNQSTKIEITTPSGHVSKFEFSQGAASDSLSGPKNQLSLSPKQGNNSIQNRSRALQEMLKNQYLHQKEILNDVIFRIMSQSYKENVLNRMDLSRFDKLFKERMRTHGLSLPYEYSIVDQNGRRVYRTPGFEDSDQTLADDRFYQVLFPSPMSSRSSYVELYFPDQGRYLLGSGLKFMIPSFIFTFCMMLVFIFTIYIVFRQKKLSEMKNDFINNMTHEFKTPISTISLASQMLNDPAVGKTPAVLKHISGVIADETKRLRFQVEKVLQMSMFDRQKTNLKLTDVNVNELIYNVVNTFTLKVEKAGGSIEAHLDAEDDICMVDEMHFTNVIFNLLDNAYKYARENVPLHLEVTTHNVGDDQLQIRIKDNGIGIKKDDLKRIFEKFYRVSTGNVHNVKGFGLGLAYVLKIVTDHKGTIKAESDFGEGTTFIITIPLMKD